MYIGEAVSIFDNGLRRAIEAIVICGGPFVGISNREFGSIFNLSPRQKAVVECLRAPRAQNFLTVIPIEGPGQHMSALEYRTILKYWLMIPLFLVDEPCPVFRKVCLDSFGEHAVHCKELPGFKYRHDLVRENGFVAGQAALKAESSKVAKHEKTCFENQHVFILFAFDTFSFLAPEAEEFSTRIQRVVQNDKNGKGERKFFKCEDPNHLIGQCPKLSRYQNQKAFVGGFWSDSDEDEEEKTKDKKCLMAKPSNEVTKMPKATTIDVSLTKSYIPKVYKIPGISFTIAQFYKPVENRNIHEERIMVDRTIKSQTVALNPNQILTKELSLDMKQWEELIQENVFRREGHRDRLPACLHHMLYYVVTKEQYNISYFFVKRIECAKATPTENLPYGMFLTRLYRYVMETYPHLDNGIYDIVERVMHHLALRQTRRPQSDCGMARRSVSFSSSHHQGTSSHQHNDDDDVKTS
uniref:Putative reverse transcriptase domain-containing protein n=1 Tax=Tanacetum cinerariifolium TaxID=118510 RepID=A0A6L2LJW6_TANCI|nr:putative reverse transcriptase domain-containing protein [Tanacetum cinerariifolium]